MAEKFNILESLHGELAHRMNEKNIQNTITTLKKTRGVSETIGKKAKNIHHSCSHALEVFADKKPDEMSDQELVRAKKEFDKRTRLVENILSAWLDEHE